jgi:hypothetical protein
VADCGINATEVDMILDLPDEDVELLFNLVMDAPLPRRRTDRVAYTMANQMQAYQAERSRQADSPSLTVVPPAAAEG